VEDLLNRGVLVLNYNYEPFNICRVKRAIVLIFNKKAEPLEYDSAKIRTVSGVFEIPSVIRMLYYIQRPKPHIQLTRNNIFARDNYTCQYCGKMTKDLTLDHVIPKRLGGKSTWENLVSACKSCNNKKGEKTLQQANMKLIKQPKPLTSHLGFKLKLNSNIPWHNTWRRYLQYDKKDDSR
jgi:5-methylcytosine-specific restriction endonuclease McrA